MTMDKRPGNGRKRIGLLTDWAAAEYQMKIIFGAVEAAKNHGVDLICAEGGCILSTREYEIQRNVVYNLINGNDVDGLIIFSGSISHFSGPEKMAEFCHDYQPLPVVSIAQEVEGCGSVVIDNSTGLKELIGHLVEEHHYRKFALITGPDGNTDSMARQEIIRKALEEYGIALDPKLIVPGDFMVFSGAEGITTLLDKRQAKFDAVIAINDDMALGALKELYAREIKVPEEIAVVGFDDFDISAYSIPPLTTINQSLHEQGVQAVELLLKLIDQQPVESTKVVMPSKLIVRESCGCFSQATLMGDPVKVDFNDNGIPTDFSKNKEAIISALIKNTQPLFAGRKPVALDRLVETIIETLDDPLSVEKKNNFLKECHAVLNQALRSYDNIFLWQKIISELRRHLLPYIADLQTLTRVEEMFHQARVLIGEKAIENEKSNYNESMHSNSILSFISENLLATFDTSNWVEVLARHLPQLGVSSCFIARLGLDPYGDDYERHLILAYNKKGPIDLEGHAVYSDRLVPEVIWEDGEPHAFLISPLNYATPFGIMGLELDHRDANIYGSLRRIVCSSLNGIILSKQVEEQLLASQRLQTKNLAGMRSAVEGFIRTILYTMEMRDPYTAGHQNKVADLATAIAIEMKLPDEMVEGIRIAGMVHDLGKISVPAEILNKPGRLRDSEMSLIKDHPQVAYDILNNLDFPWPIAQIILQHHERMNGTGYPNGLKGEEIDLEARIIAVADVIEAMASHRPYRPALGIETALDEVVKHRGAMYDSDVVEACIALFDKGYALNQ